MAVDLKMLLPEWFKDIQEFNRFIEAEEIELEEVEKNIRSVRKNCYIQTADERTISLYEKQLGLISGAMANLEERRKTVLSRLNRRVPYSMGYLKRLLSLWVGEGNYCIDTSRFTAYILGLNIKEQTLSILHDIKAEVRDIVPAHVILDFYGRYQGEYKVPVSVRDSIHFRTVFYPRYNLPHLYLDNIWSLDGSRKLNGYDSGDFIDFYPVGFKFLAEVPEAVREAEKIRAAMDAAERIKLSAEAFKLETGVKENIQNIESIAITSGITEQTTAGPVRVMNRNVMDNNWKLDGGRRLNGGLSIL